ncbi:hypothetical protein CLOM_g3524 [Closterium sp. NIES-68]|nr:hypothetical protein CLOM_g3524 [Closterium sp. NIES-68]
MAQSAAGGARRCALVVDGRQVAGGGEESGLWGTREERVTVGGESSVEWSAEGVVRKRLTTDHAVSQAAWVRMHGEAGLSSLALLHPHAITVASANGDIHEIPLPFSCPRIWPLPIGVLLHPLHPLQPHHTPPPASTSPSIRPSSSLPTPFSPAPPFAFPAPLAAAAPCPPSTSPIPFPSLSPLTPPAFSLPSGAPVANAAAAAAAGTAGKEGAQAGGGGERVEAGAAGHGNEAMGGPHVEAGCFTLTHAHDELQPVRVPASLAALHSAGEEVVWSSTEVPLLATFNHTHRQHSVWHLCYHPDPDRSPRHPPYATSAAEQDPLHASLGRVSPMPAAGGAVVREGGVGGGSVGRVGEDGGVVGDLRQQQGRVRGGGTVGSGGRQARGGGRGGGSSTGGARLSGFAVGRDDAGRGGGMGGRGGGKAGTTPRFVEGHKEGGGGEPRSLSADGRKEGEARWDVEGGGWCVHMAPVWRGLKGVEKASNVLLLSHVLLPSTSSPPSSLPCPHRSSLPPTVASLLTPSPPCATATLAFCSPAAQRVLVRRVAYGGGPKGNAEAVEEEEGRRAFGKGVRGRSGDAGRQGGVTRGGERCAESSRDGRGGSPMYEGEQTGGGGLEGVGHAVAGVAAPVAHTEGHTEGHTEEHTEGHTEGPGCWSVAAACAVALDNTSSSTALHRINRFLLLLDPQGSLVLMHGPRLLWKAPCSTFLAHHGITFDQSELATCPLRLCDPLGDRVSIALPSSKVHRFQVKLAVASSLPARCLAAIGASAFPRRLSHALRCALLAPRLWRQQRQQRGRAAAGGGLEVPLVRLCALVGAAHGANGHAGGGAGGGEGEEWGTLLAVLEEWVEKAVRGGAVRTDGGTHGGARGGEQGAEAMDVDEQQESGGGWGSERGEEEKGEAGTSAWEGLLSSQQHRQLLLSGAPPWLPFPLPSPSTTLSAPPPPRHPRREAVRAWKGVQVGGWQGEGGVGMAVGDLVALLQVLHGVYEGGRVDALWGSSLPRLAAVLWVLAAVLGLPDLCDHYQRDHPHLALLAPHFPHLLTSPLAPSITPAPSHAFLPLLRCLLPGTASQNPQPSHPPLPSVVPCVFTWLALTAQYGPEHAAPWLAWMPSSCLGRATGHVQGRGAGVGECEGVQEGAWWDEWETDGEGAVSLLAVVVALFSALFPRGAWRQGSASMRVGGKGVTARDEQVGVGREQGAQEAETDNGWTKAAAAGGGGGVVERSERCVAGMVAAGVGRQDLQRLPPGVALPLLQALHECRDSPPPHWPAAGYMLVGRDDLAATATTCPRCFSLRHSLPSPSPATRPHHRGAAEGSGPAPAAAAAAAAAAGEVEPVGAEARSQPPAEPSLLTPSPLRPPVAPPHSLSPFSFSFPPSVLIRPLSPFPASPHPALHASLAVPWSDASQGLASASGAAGVGAMGAGGGSGVGVGGASGAGLGGGGGAVDGAGGEGGVADGMEHLLLPPARSVVALRFPSDLRLAEVRALLCSSRPVPLTGSAASDSTDPDALAAHQARLWQLAYRTVALPLGRAAFTFATAQPAMTQALSVPKLVLAGRLTAQNDATVGLDGSLGNLSELTTWPEFHNGVAAGLASVQPGTITRAWVVYNRPSEASCAHGGMLLALGLRGHLRVLAPTDLFTLLALEHEATTVGILLGAAASYRGTMDSVISKMLYLHIPSRHPPSFPDLELPPIIQTSALLGVGVVYMGSAHRLTTEILLDEIGRRPEGEGSMEREGYSLAAGLALGLVTLGTAGSAWGLSDLRVEDQLQRYFSPALDPSQQGQQGASGQAEWSWGGGKGRGMGQWPGSSASSNGHVLEGNTPNLDVTAPGAILALGMMYLQSNNEAVAARLAPPATHFALELVRPDFILLRLLARSLILWDSVVPSQAWVSAQVPAIIRAAAAAGGGKAEGGWGGRMRGGGVWGGNERRAAWRAAWRARRTWMRRRWLWRSATCWRDAAWRWVRLRYAGSANSDAEKLLRSYALLFFFLRERRPLPAPSGPFASALQQWLPLLDSRTLDTAVNTAVLSLSLVMAGTGHLPSLRLLRFFHRRTAAAADAAAVNAATTYGSHMAVSLALGFLSLGACQATFSTAPSAVAALLLALFPHFPSSPSDHRCHLQVSCTRVGYRGESWWVRENVEAKGKDDHSRMRAHEKAA